MGLRRDPLRYPWLFVAIGALYAFSIPWWFGDGRPAIVAGLPSWAVVSLVCTFGVSCLTSYAARRLWDDGGGGRDDDGGGAGEEHRGDNPMDGAPDSRGN